MGRVVDKKRRQDFDINPLDCLSIGEKEEDGILMGVELEYHAVGDDVSLDVIEMIQNLDNFIVKVDGSLGMGGYEIVSAPLSLNSHKNSGDWSFILGLADSSICMGRDTEAGLHIHVNRDSGIDFRKTRALIYSNPDFFFKRFAHRDPDNEYGGVLNYIEGRLIEDSEDEYSDDDDASGDGTILRGEGLYPDDRREIRYQAVNVRTKDCKTVEFRMFASTKNLVRLYQSLEFCHSLADYTRKMPLSPLVKPFFDFIESNKKLYPVVYSSFYRNGRLFFPAKPQVVLADIKNFT